MYLSLRNLEQDKTLHGQIESQSSSLILLPGSKIHKAHIDIKIDFDAFFPI